MSLPLLLVTTVAYSECEHFRPILWEAYSAGSARDELSSGWQGIDRYVLDLVAMLIVISYTCTKPSWYRKQKL